MKSTVIFTIIATMFICIGWLIGGIFTPIFTGIGAILSTIALIKTIIERRKAK